MAAPPRADQFLQAFHRQNPGCTSAAFAAGKSASAGVSSYAILAAAAAGTRVLDLGCGDGYLLSLLAERPDPGFVVGVDFSAAELARAKISQPTAMALRGAAQALPLASHSFDCVVSHFAFHLMSDIEEVVAEIGRVLVPGGRFAAIVGGGPKCGDAFELFLDLLRDSQLAPPEMPRLGDMRARTEPGLRQLFAEHAGFSEELEIVDDYVDFGGNFAKLWPRLATVYELGQRSQSELLSLRQSFRDALDCGDEEHIHCTMAVRLVIATRQSTRRAHRASISEA